MTANDIPYLRLTSQQIAASKLSKPADLVKWMGCIQAQDYAGAKWAIGNRINGITDAQIEHDLDKGKILRTHVLRPTWHFVSPQDIGWMLQLTAPKVKAMSKPYHRKLGMDAAVLKNSRVIIIKALQRHNYLTREELTIHLNKGKIDTSDIRLGFLLMDAELDGIICSGPRKGNKFTYALLAERVSKIKLLDKDESIATLAKTYFQSHGPATRRDFAWWSGLTLTESKLGIELNKKQLSSETIDNQTYWFVKNTASVKEQQQVHLLPAYDEYTVAYKDRSLVLPANCIKPTGNGIFKPTIVVNGQVAGTWKSSFVKDKVLIELTFINKVADIFKIAAHKEALRYATFLDMAHPKIKIK